MEGYLACPVCFELFDDSAHVPLLLCCGHSLCKECVVQISRDSLVCPLDRLPELRSLDELPKNISLLQIACHRNSKKYIQCPGHPGKKIKYYCFNCKNGFCANCMTSHLMHSWADLESNESINQKLKDPVDRLIAGISQAYERAMAYSSHANTIKEYKINALQTIKNQFCWLRNRLEKKEKEILENAKTFFRELEDSFSEKLSNAKFVLENRQELFRNIEVCAGQIARQDSKEKIESLITVDKLISDSFSIELLPFEMFQGFEVKVDGCSQVKKVISMLSIEIVQELGKSV